MRPGKLVVAYFDQCLLHAHPLSHCTHSLYIYSLSTNGSTKVGLPLRPRLYHFRASLSRPSPPLNPDSLHQPVTYPQLPNLCITCDLIPQWPIDLELHPNALAALVGANLYHMLWVVAYRRYVICLGLFMI